jgi:hypothetical protein
VDNRGRVTADHGILHVGSGDVVTSTLPSRAALAGSGVEPSAGYSPRSLVRRSAARLAVPLRQTAGTGARAVGVPD